MNLALALLSARLLALAPADTNPVNDEVLGGEAFAEGQFIEAAEHFADCLRRGGAISCAFNSIGALRAANQLLYAKAAVEHVLAGRWGKLSKLQLHEAVREFEELSRMIPVVNIKLEGLDIAETVEIIVDGESAYAGRAQPTHAIPLDPGEHRITATAEGLVAESIEVALTRSEARDLTLILLPDPELSNGTLIVATGSATHQVLVEGQGVEFGGYKGKLPEGRYRVSVRDGNRVNERVVNVTARETLLVNLDPRGSHSEFLSSPWFWAATSAVITAAAATIVFMAKDRHDSPPAISNERLAMFEAYHAMPPY